MASDYDATEFVDGDLQAHKLPHAPASANMGQLHRAPTREEAAQVLGISMARQHEITGQCPSLTKQRREVLGHRKEIEGLGRNQGGAHAELLPSPKNRSNHAAIVNISTGCEDQHGPHLVPKQTSCIIENVGPPDMREAALT